MKIFVTGCNGTISSYLLRNLKTRGHELISYTRSSDFNICMNGLDIEIHDQSGGPNE